MPEPLIAPITTGGAPFVGGTLFDLAPLGYDQAEFTLSGTASAYARAADGLSVVEEAAYTTRVLVHRPTDPGAFNGTVWVEWLNVSGGLDAAPDWSFVHTELMRSGAAWVGVSAQAIGVHGGEGIVGMSSPGLVGTDPARYGTLEHPGDRFSYDIYSQAGRAVRHAAGTLLGGLGVERALAIGESQSAFRLTTYANDIDPIAEVFDGFLVHARGGTGAPLSDGDDPLAAMSGDPVRFRADRRVPVLCVQAETDLMNLGYLPARQDDDESFVLWEIAGTSHADVYVLSVGAIDTGALPLAELAQAWRPSREVLGMELDLPVNAGPQHYVMNAAVSHLDRWLRDRTRPPAAARMEVVDGAFVTDEHGNVRGGIRTPHVDVPVAVLSGLGNGGAALGFLAGSTTPFDAGKLAALYPSRADYSSRFDAATDAAVDAGFVLAADAPEIKAVAAENSPI
ncbi:MAG: alpha/beta hydrolase domain-containing protein [Acidimicrobiia bacterium]